MPKKYVFEFPGTKDEFLNSLKRFNHRSSYSSGTLYYLDDYIIKLMDDEIHFGVARGGHSGGYWFVPTITELEGSMEFHGEIRYIGSGEHDSAIRKAIDKIGNVLLFLLFLPIILLIRFYMFIEWLVRKICNCPNPKEKTDEARLFELMVDYLGCVRK